MSNLAIQDLYQRKIDEASEMSTRELISALKGSISSPKALSRDSMIDIVAMKLANDELRVHHQQIPFLLLFPLQKTLPKVQRL